MSGAHNTRFVGNVLCDDRNKIRVAVSIMELAIKGVVQFLYDLPLRQDHSFEADYASFRKKGKGHILCSNSFGNYILSKAYQIFHMLSFIPYVR